MSIDLRDWPVFMELTRRAQAEERRGRVDSAQDWRDIRWSRVDREFVSGIGQGFGFRKRAEGSDI